MDRFGGSFGAHDDAHDDAGPPFAFDGAFDGALGDSQDDTADAPPEPPVSPVGQDERRMQVRAYNHWAALLGAGNFPVIDDLKPESLDDFGPHGVLLDFSDGIDDPAIRFLGARLAEECGSDEQFGHLSEVPGRSLLSRITDHYMQIIANQAPIGFEAEFVNQHGATVLYRGILLPWSSDGTAIDYIFGVINWKEMADAATADALLAAIDAAFEAPVPPYQEKDMDRMLDLSGFSEESVEPFALDDAAEAATPLPTPAFGAPAGPAARISSPFDLTDEADEGEEESEDETGAASEWGKGFSGFGDDDTVYSVDYGDQGLEDGEGEEDDFDGVIDPLADQSSGLGLASLVSRGLRVKQSVQLPGMPGSGDPEPAPAFAVPQAYEPEEVPAASVLPQAYEPELLEPEAFELEAEASEDNAFVLDETFEDLAPTAEAAEPVFATEHEEMQDTPPALSAFDAEPEGLYDCLAAARELAQTASSSEDRGRKALYQAVARAYDFSLEAAANPADFDELCAENGLTVQDRAPMTPVVKLVFGADYDKTRLTEYATVLGYAHRTGVARGTLDTLLAGAEGGLKGVVQAERRARKEADGKAVAAPEGVRNSLAKKLRKLDQFGFEDLDAEGAEFALVMVRRLPSGELVVLGEVPEDVALVEKAARKLLR